MHAGEAKVELKALHSFMSVLQPRPDGIALTLPETWAALKAVESVLDHWESRP